MNTETIKDYDLIYREMEERFSGNGPCRVFSADEVARVADKIPETPRAPVARSSREYRKTDRSKLPCMKSKDQAHHWMKNGLNQCGEQRLLCSHCRVSMIESRTTK